MIRKLLQHSVNLIPWRVRRVVKQVPVVAKLQRIVVRRWLSDQDFVHTINAGPARGLQVRIALPADKGLWTGTYEAEFAEALAAAVKRGGVAYDIGAFRGFMSGVMGLAGARTVVAFEPHEANVKRIRELAALNPQLNISVQPIAVGKHDGDVGFEQMPEASMGKISESGFQSDIRGGFTVRVQMRSIDSLLQGSAIPPPDIIKIDVEGAELQVLQGARATVATYRPVVCVEAHSPALANQCRAFFDSVGYIVSFLNKGASAFDDGVCHLTAAPVAAHYQSDVR